MGTGAGPGGGPGKLLKRVVVAAAVVGALCAAPNAFAGVYTVNSTLDTGGACVSSFCTLRQAIEAANTTAGPDVDTITFQIGIGGSYTLSPSTPLPTITTPTVIDARTQTGYA